MANNDATGLDLRQVIERFPKDALLIRRLWMANQDFRIVCEDYALARRTLVTFESLADAHQKPDEVADYLSVVADLEAEIRALLGAAAQSTGDT